MSISEMIKNNEKVFKGAVELKYLFITASVPSDFLIVGFSGFNGKEAQGEPAKYNYVKQLKNFDCNKLYILDSYDNHPCYYLGENKTLDYETTTVALIHYIANQYNISTKNIITSGSSKGGSAALYFGLKYKFGHVVAGGMQIKVGDYIYNVGKYTRDTSLKLITGGTKESDRDYLDNFYITELKRELKNTQTNLYIHGGKGDHHYINHVLPFIEILKENNIPYLLDVKDYSAHSELGTYFSEFLLDQVAKITNKIVIKDVLIQTGDKKITVSCRLADHFANDRSVEYAYYIFSGPSKEPIKKIMYSKSPTVNVEVEESKDYRARIFVRKNGEIVRIGTGSVIV